MSDTPATTFAQLGLNENLLRVLEELGYEAPTPIQEQTIPVLLSGRDLIGQAQTGTGKTAAFALPIIEKVDRTARETQALILAPTRELAMQVAEAIHTYAKGIEGLSVLPVYGGAPIVLQMKHLQRGAQIVVGTPGRLIDHLERKTLKLDKVKFVVLDEADEMLKMGFIEEVERILSEVPAPRQVALFSATMPDEIARIARKHLVDPQRVEIEHKQLTAPSIEQRFINLAEGQKLEVLTQLLEIEPSEGVLIFRRTRNGAAELAEKLEARGFAAVAMHGDMTQALRENVIRRLRGGLIEIVVATDVAARGLDVEQITHVINYDVPHDVEVYVHRIGRTGRAGRAGMATLFITPRERRMMREIERFTGAPMMPMKMPTMADVAVRRISVFKENLLKNLGEGDLDLYVQLVEQLAEEGPFDMAEVAAAAARLANGSRSLAPQPEPRGYEKLMTQDSSRSSRDDRDFEKPARSSRPPAPFGDSKPYEPREPRGPREGDDEPKVRLSMAVGKRDGIRPADIVGSIANEADIPGREIGPIDIKDDITYVVIPEKYRDKVLTQVASAKFRGRPVDIKVAMGVPTPRSRDDEFAPGARSGGYAKREYAPRQDGKPAYGKKDFGAKPAYAKRDAGAGAKPYAKKEYTPRDGAKPAYPKKDFAPREGGKPDYPKREYAKKDYTGRTAAPAPRYASDSEGPRRPAGTAPFYSRAAGTSKPASKPFVKKPKR